MLEMGKKRRLSRIFKRSERTLIIPMEWGTQFASNDWSVCASMTNAVIEGGADAIMTTYGQARKFAEHLLKVPLVITINYGSSDSAYPLEYVKDVSQLGAEAVKVHFFGPLAGIPILELQRLSSECKNYGMPFLFEPIPMSDYPSAGGKQLLDPKVIKQAVDIGVIVGADIVKTAYTGSAESFREVSKGCPIPVIIAGGLPRASDKETLDMIEGAMRGGASGGAIGRNITTHKNPMKMTKAVSKIIHEGVSVEDALRVLASDKDPSLH